MKAHVINQFGGPEVFQTANIPIPKLIPGHVLIRVQATSINPLDTKIRAGFIPQLVSGFPAVLHGDVVGVIEAVSPDVTQFKVGDEVYGCAGGVKGSSGALAELMLADAHLLAKKPTGLSIKEVAALPLVTITASEALFDKAKLQAGQTILIHGGVGGVGHIAIQLAKQAGAKVFTTVLKDPDFALAKSLGADEVINAKEDVASYVQRLTNGNGFDVIFDTVGGDNLPNSFQAAKLNGAVVTTAARSMQDLTKLHEKGLSFHVVFMLMPLLTGVNRAAHGKLLSKAAALVEARKLKPLLDTKYFNIDQVREAHAYFESGQARGKVVLIQS